MLARLNQSVEQGGFNIRNDVLLVQKLLNKHTIPGAFGVLREDGIVGIKTITRIELFQKHIVKMIRADGRIDPNGKSFKLLRELKANTSQVDLRLTKILTLSSRGVSLLKSIEDLALKPYDDQTGKDITEWVKGATIGYGHLIAGSDWDKYKNGISEAAASSLFSSDLRPFIQTVKNKVTTSLKQNEFDALVILAFNIGVFNFSTSSVLKLINAPEAKTSYENLEAAWKAWNKSQGKEIRGLKNRRQAEWDIYSKNIYKQW
ncbi:lysozyme [Cellvibrio sp. BR]|uniref:lysozyme n=1 Tax=Cellvibrio sp. BR TaxID=1134474 RepID=UPI0026A3CE86|nr:lysozyme [Cellvibrio sp. BR]